MHSIISPAWRGAVCRVFALAVSTFSILASVAAAPARATTLYVAKSGVDNVTCGVSTSNACLTIQYTLDNHAKNDDVIVISPGTYSELVTINKRVVINGQKKGAVIINGQGLGTTVSVVGGAQAELEYVSITGGAVLSIDQPFQTGGIGNGGTLSLFNSSVEGNSTSAPDPEFDVIQVVGGIENDGTMNIYASTITNNSASGSCYSVGGILNEGSLFMDYSTVSGNSASQADDCDFGPGGIIGVTDGLWNQGDVTIDTTLFQGNKISNSGGAFNMTRSTITGAHEDAMDLYEGTNISNSTIASNGAGVNVVFGFYGYNGSAYISNSTIVNNGGPGIQGPNGGLTAGVSNSILYGNAGGDCIGRGLGLSPYNLIGDPSGCSSLSGSVNLVGVDPKLSSLRPNGGPTSTMIPLPGSPVINAGDPAGCTDFVTNKLRTTDQRLLPSPSPANQPCDLGAVEVEPHDPGRY